MPVRFDARYFTLAGDADPVADDVEVAAAWWTTPGDLLAEWASGERKLYWPTWKTVTELAACASVDDVRALRFDPREPTADEEATMPRHVMEQE